MAHAVEHRSQSERIRDARRELAESAGRALAIIDELNLQVQSERCRRHGVEYGAESQELITLEEVEKSYILRVLMATGNRKHEACAILGINPSTLFRKEKEWAREPDAN